MAGQQEGLIAFSGSTEAVANCCTHGMAPKTSVSVHPISVVTLLVNKGVDVVPESRQPSGFSRSGLRSANGTSKQSTWLVTGMRILGAIVPLRYSISKRMRLARLL